MDNNFNQQAPQQMPQQPVYQQMPQQQMAPQQQMYQQMPQQQMYQQPMYQAPAPKEPKNMKEFLALILAASGALLAILGATFTCSCSASKSMKAGGYALHPIFILAIIAAMVGAGAVVLAIMALKEENAPIKAGKLSYIAIAVGIFAVVYALLPVFTICGYNCSLKNAKEKAVEDAMNQLNNYFK